MLNETQRHVLKAYLGYLLDDISSSQYLTNTHALNAMQAVYDIYDSSRDVLYSQHRQDFVGCEILDIIDELITIARHPCPQNRRVGDPTAASNRADGILNGRACYWSEGFGSIILSEPVGLLGLTAKNDDTSAPVTKGDVIRFILNIIQYKIDVLKGQVNIDDLIEARVKAEEQSSRLKEENQLLRQEHHGECTRLMQQYNKAHDEYTRAREQLQSGEQVQRDLQMAAAIQAEQFDECLIKYDLRAEEAQAAARNMEKTLRTAQERFAEQERRTKRSGKKIREPQATTSMHARDGDRPARSRHFFVSHIDRLTTAKRLLNLHNPFNEEWQFNSDGRLFILLPNTIQNYKIIDSMEKMEMIEAEREIIADFRKVIVTNVDLELLEKVLPCLAEEYLVPRLL